jgi:hypothetical protein
VQEDGKEDGPAGYEGGRVTGFAEATNAKAERTSVKAVNMV